MRRFCIVTRSVPKWPGIFMVLLHVPGVRRVPIDPPCRKILVRSVAADEALEVVALHDAREPAALARPDHVDDVLGLEQIDRELLARLELARLFVAEPELDEIVERLDRGLREMAGLRLRRPRLLRGPNPSWTAAYLSGPPTRLTWTTVRRLPPP
jgi:hypothetical protein